MHHLLRLIILVLIALLLRLVPPQEVDFLVLLAHEEHVRGPEREGKSDDDDDEQRAEADAHARGAEGAGAAGV